MAEQGRWLAEVVRGYFAYHAVPTSPRALQAFRHHVMNGQLTALCALFLREGRTASEYSLCTLGTRPGLVRGGTGSIAGEVWAVPTVGIGALLALVPPPLSFGTV